jgi:YaiO family outer membrane protein
MPAAAQSPDLFTQAVAARQAGNPERAVTLLEPLVAAEPANSDAQLQLGLAYLALDRLAEAEAAFDRTLAIAPDYADARIGLARVAQRRGDRAGALAQIAPLGVVNPEAAALRAQLADSDQSRWRLDLDGNISALEGGQRDWHEVTAALGYQLTPATAIGGRVEVLNRFGLNDVYGEVRVDHRLNGRAAIYATLGGTPDADFRPEWQIGLGGSLRLRDGGDATVLTIEARQARYAVGDIQTVSPGIEQYLFDGRFWATARWINIFDETGIHRSGYSLRGDALAGEHVRLFAGFSDAPDPDQGVVIDTFGIFGGVSVDISADTTLRASVAHEDRSIGADRLQFALGLGWRF